MASTLFGLVYNSSRYVVESLQAAILPSSRKSSLTSSDAANNRNRQKQSNAYRPKLIRDGRKVPRRPIDVANEEMDRWMLDYQMLKQYLQENPDRTIDAMPKTGLLRRWWSKQEREYYSLTLEQIRLLQEIAAIGNDHQGDQQVNIKLEKDQSNTHDASEDPPETPATSTSTSTHGPATRLRSRQGINTTGNVTIKQEYHDNSVVSLGSGGSFYSAVTEEHENSRLRHILPAKRACPTPRVTPYHVHQRQQQQQQHLQQQHQTPMWEELEIDHQLMATLEAPDPIQSNTPLPTRQPFRHTRLPATTATTPAAASHRNHTPEQPPRKKQRTQPTQQPSQRRSNQVSPSPLSDIHILYSHNSDENDLSELDSFNLSGFNDYDDVRDYDHDDNEMDHDAYGDYIDNHLGDDNDEDFGDDKDGDDYNDDNDDDDDDDEDVSEDQGIFADLTGAYKRSRISNGMKDFGMQDVAGPSPPSRAQTLKSEGPKHTPKTPKRRPPAKANTNPRPANGRVIPSHRPNAATQQQPKKKSKNSRSRKSSSATPVAATQVITVPMPSAVAKFSGESKRINRQTKFQVQFRDESQWVWAPMDEMDELACNVARSILKKERHESRLSLRTERAVEQRPGSFLQTGESTTESPMRQHVRSPATPRQPIPARVLETTPRYMDHRPLVPPSPQQNPVQRPGSVLPEEESLTESPMGHHVRSPATPRQPIPPAHAPEPTARYMDHPHTHVSPSPRQIPVHERQTTHRYSHHHDVTSVASQRHPPSDRMVHRDPRFECQPRSTTQKTPYYPPHRRPPGYVPPRYC